MRPSPGRYCRSRRRRIGRLGLHADEVAFPLGRQIGHVRDEVPVLVDRADRAELALGLHGVERLLDVGRQIVPRDFLLDGENRTFLVHHDPAGLALRDEIHPIGHDSVDLVGRIPGHRRSGDLRLGGAQNRRGKLRLIDALRIAQRDDTDGESESDPGENARAAHRGSLLLPSSETVRSTCGGERSPRYRSYRAEPFSLGFTPDFENFACQKNSPVALTRGVSLDRVESGSSVRQGARPVEAVPSGLPESRGNRILGPFRFRRFHVNSHPQIRRRPHQPFGQHAHWRQGRQSQGRGPRQDRGLHAGSRAGARRLRGALLRRISSAWETSSSRCRCRPSSTDARRSGSSSTSDKERLKNAPGFDKNHWPDMSDRSFGTTVYSYYNTKPYWH